MACKINERNLQEEFLAQSGAILFQAARLSWQNGPHPKGAKGKAVLGPILWLSHHTAWQYKPTSFMPRQDRWLPPPLPASFLQCSAASESGLGLCVVGVCGLCSGPGCKRDLENADLAFSPPLEGRDHKTQEGFQVLDH